jgi:hypothetical protein
MGAVAQQAGDVNADAIDALDALKVRLDFQEETCLAWSDLAWSCEALHAAGEWQRAEDLLRRALETVRVDQQGLLPAGSLPACLPFQDSVWPSPLIFDTEAGAWLLAALYRHTLARPDREGVIFIGQHWKVVRDLGDFLSGWHRGTDPAPLYTAGPDGRSIVTPQLDFSFYMGLNAAAALAEEVGKDDTPRWRARARSLAGILKGRALDEESPAEVTPALASYLNRVFPEIGEETPVRVRVSGEVMALDSVPLVPAVSESGSAALVAACRVLLEVNGRD